ncbi:hypothetical protein FHW69_003594 [Luteibacter sp. Sphag1AF]|uniref:DUF3142 domain-containing protein n=1 Tax=Luteibacter sp. Sphag1AF TaxID=2587031 RepID=UPI001621774A|nr:DUF3142 domain-containing protein [Luteibacter sp. Sphag1AF]MBB3228946.1 hypothetical protein [Luteibacter sp. Sphag1AF]
MLGWRTIVIFFVLALATACDRARTPLTQDAYIWQRTWTPALRASVDTATDAVSQWRVLAAQVDADGQFRTFSPDVDSLLATKRPVVLVVRIDGRLANLDAAALVERIAELSARSDSRVGGIEIDYDCATAKLPAYAAFLSTLKPRLPGRWLSITALPAWMDSKQVDTVTAAVDEAVLQVHAVQSPHAGLFDADMAYRWIRSFAKHTRAGYRVALPTYGSRVSWDGDGRLLAVESEKAGLVPGSSSAELAASPREVSRLLDLLEKSRPANLRGIVWFRLPTSDDQRAWSMTTWLAVMRGRYVDGHVATVFQPAATPGMLDVLIRNDGDTDAVVPASVDLPEGCRLADGIKGYVLHRDGNAVTLRTDDARFLRAHTQQAIGWTRCGAPATPSPTPSSSSSA